MRYQCVHKIALAIDRANFSDVPPFESFARRLQMNQQPPLGSRSRPNDNAEDRHAVLQLS